MNPIIIKMLAAPVFGLIIGYFTNWIAVKMLFRPREAKYIGRFQVPLTPGVIPKGKARVAAAAREIINEQLITPDAMKQRLLSDDITGMIDAGLCSVLDHLKDDETRSIRSCILTITEEDNLNLASNKVQEIIVQHAMERLRQADVGQALADIAARKVYEHIARGSMLSRLIGDSVMPSIAPLIKQYVDEYIDQNAESMIRTLVREEITGLLDSSASEAIIGLEDQGYYIHDILLRLYRRIVDHHMEGILKAVDAGALVQQVILDMDNEQLETLVLSAMKNELGAVVRFGALIGFVLGLFNMVIYLI